MSKQEETAEPAKDIPILLKIGAYFIHEEMLRSVARFGRGSKITLSNGDELAVNVNYDKLSALVKWK
jgi:hypothetical protein